MTNLIPSDCPRNVTSISGAVTENRSSNLVSSEDVTKFQQRGADQYHIWDEACLITIHHVTSSHVNLRTSRYEKKSPE